MGLHTCHHPCWHRALILFGMLLYLHGALYLAPWYPPILCAVLVSTWLVKHLLQWRCQGREPSDGRLATSAALFMGGAYLVGRSDHE